MRVRHMAPDHHVVSAFLGHKSIKPSRVEFFVVVDQMKENCEITHLWSVFTWPENDGTG